MKPERPVAPGEPAEKGCFYELDDMGFLAAIQSWSPEFLERFALEEGIPVVTEAHRVLVNYAREFFLQRGRSPMPPEYARYACCGMKRIHELFPKGLMSIHRLAGLPQPKSC